MTKDVLISISGLHTETWNDKAYEAMAYEEDGAIEVVTPANYYWKNGKHYVLYDEVVEGMAGTIKNKIKITGNERIEIMKTGLSNAHMVFEKDKKNLTYYEMPLGQILVSVNTRKMEVDVTEHNIDVMVEYELDVNHEPLADCQIRMNIVPRGKTGLQP